MEYEIVNTPQEHEDVMNFDLNDLFKGREKKSTKEKFEDKIHSFTDSNKRYEDNVAYENSLFANLNIDLTGMGHNAKHESKDLRFDDTDYVLNTNNCGVVVCNKRDFDTHKKQISMSAKDKSIENKKLSRAYLKHATFSHMMESSKLYDHKTENFPVEFKDNLEQIKQKLKQGYISSSKSKDISTGDFLKNLYDGLSQRYDRREKIDYGTLESKIYLEEYKKCVMCEIEYQEKKNFGMWLCNFSGLGSMDHISLDDTLNIERFDSIVHPTDLRGQVILNLQKNSYWTKNASVIILPTIIYTKFFSKEFKNNKDKADIRRYMKEKKIDLYHSSILGVYNKVEDLSDNPIVYFRKANGLEYFVDVVRKYSDFLDGIDVLSFLLFSSHKKELSANEKALLQTIKDKKDSGLWSNRVDVDKMVRIKNPFVKSELDDVYLEEKVDSFIPFIIISRFNILESESYNDGKRMLDINRFFTKYYSIFE